MNAFIVGNVHIPVMSVISHSLARVDGRYISAYIVVSAHITVIRAISHSI